uniref:NADH-ubiquinone oxidoreductase chain 2 n=1 Tax=Phlyctis petraea TaxID=2054620 RepID=A0A4P8D2N4_9LECA|nr:NADH dehydrogenase subunit 2 [Phlyctis petraea]QCI56400.1 NADH dehydrogenase subunit 2 [Phlyctis petraea]
MRRDLSIFFSRSLLTIILKSFSLGFFSLKISSLKKGIGLFGGLFHTTALTNFFHIFILFICIIILQLTSFFPMKISLSICGNFFNFFSNKLQFIIKLFDNKGEQYKILEYPLILLFIVTGAVFLISSSDIVSIFLSIELQSYGLYILCTMYRNSELSTSAGLTYFLLGGLSSCFILLGTSLLYVNSGTTNLDGFYIITNLSGLKDNLLFWYSTNYINFSLLIMSVGFLFKISAAPFHFWSPDVYDAIPTIVTTFVANIAKLSIFIFLFELVYYTSNYYSIFNFNWTISLLFSSLLSLIIGTILGLNQSRIKRLLAYSTISHLGFILLALSINSIESIQAFIFYIMQYSLSNVNAFIILISMGYILYTYNNDKFKNLVEKYNSPIQFTEQLKGYFFINPYLAISLSITIYSFVGIPPLLGFFGKQMVLSAALDNGYIFITLVAILTSVISAAYYLNIVKEMFFNKSEYTLNTELNNAILNNIIQYYPKTIKNIKIGINNMVLSNSLTLTISILTLIIILFMINPQEWLSVTNILSTILYN